MSYECESDPSDPSDLTLVPRGAISLTTSSYNIRHYFNLVNLSKLEEVSVFLQDLSIISIMEPI